MTRWLAVDHGTRRIGVAVGDDAAGIASPLEALDATRRDVAQAIAELAREYAAAGIVVGWPLNDDSSEGPQAAAARAFAIDLAATTGMDVRLWDETLSSFEADLRLRGLHTRKGRRQRHDAVAAAAFLADFLAAHGARVAPRAADAAAPRPPRRRRE